MNKKHIVVLSGAGVSAESGIPTFRGADGLWEGYRVDEVATPGAWERDYKLVLDFYNFRRKAVLEADPNQGHRVLAELENDFEVTVITQNIDDLHERGGSSNVLHLHGEIRKVRSTANPRLVYELEGWELKDGDKCELGSQLRPHIVWFGEAVPMMEPAIDICTSADALIVVGTSLQVYPAAGLIHAVDPGVPKFLVDPNIPMTTGVENLKAVAATGSEGLGIVAEELRRIFL